MFIIFTITNDEELTMNYLLKDHLGIINYILDATGKVEQQLNYDAWGRRRDPDTWQYYSSSTTPPTPMFDRGFTMHEHLSAFKLINMNGRMYDPVMSRFLSPDPIIQFPANSQSYNSYSYVLNNPLKFTDPSGFLAEGDSTANGKNTNWSEATAKALNIVGSSYDKEEESISSFNTDYTQTGKTEFITEENSVSDKTKAVEGDRRVGSADGGITFGEADGHYKWGFGEPLYVDLDKIDFGDVTMARFNNPEFYSEGHPGVYVRFETSDYVNRDQALIYGTIGIVKIGDNTIMAMPDIYDFDLKLKDGSFIRDAATVLGKTYAGWGIQFPIYFRGTTTLP